VLGFGHILGVLKMYKSVGPHQKFISSHIEIKKDVSFYFYVFFCPFTQIKKTIKVMFSSYSISSY